jgi:hypothetical protein
MVRLVFVIAICALAGVTHAEEELGVKDVVRFAAMGDKEFLNLVVGVGRGVEGANVMSGLKDQGAALYCQPNIAITGDQYVRIIENYVEGHPKQGSLNPSMIGVVMTLALKDAFPCK